MQKPNQMVPPGVPGGPPVGYLRDLVDALEKRVAALEAQLGVKAPAAATTKK